MYWKCDYLTKFYFILRTIQNNDTLFFIDEETYSERLRNFPKFTQLVSSRV